MLTPRQVFRRLRDLVRGKRLDADVDDEIRFHIEMQTDALVAGGMAPGRARAKAESDFGIDVRVSDGVRRARGLASSNFAEEVARDVRFAARSLRRAPAFSAVAIATLALGIGATTAMFSVVDGVLLRALPYPNAERLVRLRERGLADGRPYTSDVSAPNFADWRAQARSVDLMAAFRGDKATILGLAEPISADVYLVSMDYFRVFGGTPMLGRTFTADESRVGGPHVAVVSESFWRDQLGARRDLANVHLETGGVTFTVIGVMPQSFGFPENIQLWAPLEPDDVGDGRDSHNDETVARLAPGVTIAQAESELDAIAKRLKAAYPNDNAAVGAQVVSLRDALVGPVQRYLRLLLGAVVVVLLVACVNLASANLARGVGRARELAIRSVLGAGRGRLVRQLLTESLLVAAIGGAGGLLIARFLVRALLALNPRALPRASEIGIDARVMLFALGVTVVTGLVIGVLPALQLGRGELRADITVGGRGAAVGRSGVRRTLLAAEVALTVLLLVGAGLLVRSFRALLEENPGFAPDGVLAVNVALPSSRYPAGEQRSRYFTAALDALRSIPGVERVGMINIAPLSRSGFGGGVIIDGQPKSSARYTDYRVVSPDYFATMRIPVLAGRVFTDADDSTSQHVTVINEAMAKKFFPDGNALGKRLIELGMDDHKTPMTVVGVVADVRSDDLSRPPGPQHFVPYRQRPERALFGVLMIRTSMDPASIGAVARARLRRFDANVLTRLETVTDIRARSLGDRRFAMVVLSGFAVLGLVLAAIGIYGVLAYSVARRTREIGVRIALGAVRARVVTMVLRDSLAPVVVGSVVGVAAALALTRLMSALLYGVAASDPLTFAAVVSVLFVVAVLASAIPAWRAARVDPVVALREE